MDLKTEVEITEVKNATMDRVGIIYHQQPLIANRLLTYKLFLCGN
jgi:hypothetical protein